MTCEAMTIPAACRQAAHRYGAEPAIDEGGLILSFNDLDRLRLRVARALRHLGVGPGDRVAVWAPNGHRWISAALGAMSLGAILVPINTRMKGEEAAHLLAVSRARVLFCAGSFLGQYYPDLLRTHMPASLKSVVVLESPHAGDLGWESFLALSNATPPAEVEALAAAVSPEDLSDIMFTSGTTGYPKGVMTNHRQNLRVVRDWSRVAGLQRGDRYLIVNPFFHAFGYKAGWLAALVAGATVVPHQVYDSDEILRRIQEERISVLPGPPTLFLGMLAHPRISGFDLSSLRISVTGAATIAPSLIEAMRSRLGFQVVLTGYGLTESSGFATLSHPDDDAETVATTSGRAMPGVEICCVRSTGEPAAPGQSGEILIRGYNVMQGYLDDPVATKETIDGDGWLHTGDIGILDERGYLRITDRLKDMFIVGGFNCYPAEIERMIQAHEAIAQVAVLGVPDERMGEVGKAIVVLKAGATLTAEGLITWCREHMANYKVPRSVEIVDALPTNASGKVLKYQLRKASS